MSLEDLARALVEELSEAVRQSFVIDNPADGVASIGIDLVAKARLDDYRLPFGPAHPLTMGVSLCVFDDLTLAARLGTYIARLHCGTVVPPSTHPSIPRN